MDDGGIAGRAQQTLSENGVTVSRTGNAESFDYAETEVVSYGARGAGLELARIFGIPPSRVREASPSSVQSDPVEEVVLILGADYRSLGF